MKAILFSYLLPVVPIYDTRDVEGFKFDPDNLKNIKELPRYKKGTADLPVEKHAVTVTYTVGTYMYTGETKEFVDKSMTAASFNVLFVIILGRLEGN
jgi:hypothetical protein